MFDVLREHIQKRIDLTDEEFSRSTAFFTPRRIKRRRFLLQEGDICRALAFVNKGCLRSYTVDPDGKEHIVQFAIEDWWISDL